MFTLHSWCRFDILQVIILSHVSQLWKFSIGVYDIIGVSVGSLTFINVMSVSALTGIHLWSFIGGCVCLGSSDVAWPADYYWSTKVKKGLIGFSTKVRQALVGFSTKVRQGLVGFIVKVKQGLVGFIIKV